MPEKADISELRRPFLGRWRITGADIFDRDHLDLCGPARLIVPAKDWGEIAFGAFVAGLDFSYAPGMLLFDWRGHDEMDESTREGSMVLTGTDRGEIELEFDNGDAAILRAIRIDRSGADV